ncbi:MAG TPA: DUF1566 domain-containing protein [Thermodesulfovibrionia bacterium]|nr:DUF1566 domain-containing protein [Thermodesulfovibrionia bacterium]
MSKINNQARCITIYTLITVLLVFLPEKVVLSAPKCTVLGDGVMMYTREAVSEKPGFYQLVEEMFDAVITQSDRLPFGKSVAFLAGVSDYEHLSPQLPFVKNDLEDMRTFLLTKGGFDTVYVAYGDIVNRDLIETYIKDKLPKEYSSHDRLLFYYSGHGADGGGRTGYMQFSGAQPDKFAGNQVMPMNDAVDWCSELHFSHILVIFDSCSSGLGYTPKGNTGEPYRLINTLSRNGSRIVLTAGTANEETFEVESLNNHGNGVFTRAFLHAIDSGMADKGPDGFMTIDEVIARIKDEVADFSVKYRKSLTPRIWQLEPATYPGSFVFVNPEAGKKQIPLQQEYAEKLNARLRPKGQDVGAFGKIHLISFIAGKVYIDNVYWEDIESGQAKIIMPVPAGPHTIEVKGDKGNSSQTVDVRQGERADVTIDLPEEQTTFVQPPAKKPVPVKPQPSPTPEPKIKLRSEPIENLSDDEVKTMLKEKGFYDSDWNKSGKGIDNIYEVQEKNGDKVVVDNATGLMWQQSGSPNYMQYADTTKYILKLNDEGFAGFKGWRLPTLEEAMSLVEPKQNNGLYIDPLFDSTQKWIWTADESTSSPSWRVSFTVGDVDWGFSDINYVRAVRSIQ